VNRVREIASNF